MSFKPVTARDPESRSADLTAEQIEHLPTLFPAAFREGRVDFEVLRQLLGGAVDEREERYGLNWHGKRAARQLALTPSAGTLRPAPGESVEWDATRNMVIEGENLEVLKLLQKPYAGKVKLIYIDPPYNTGKDFIYPDNFRDSIRHYLELTGQTGEEGQKLTTNPEASGRFHTDWLNMMYPRLFLARNLLKEDGAIFVSIDDHEVAHLRLLMDEIFGPENFVAQLTVVVNPRGRHLDRFVARTHDSMLVFARRSACPAALRGKPKSGEMLDEYSEGPDGEQYREIGLRNRNQAFNPETRPNLYYPLYVDPETGSVSVERGERCSEEVWPDAPGGVKTCWTWGREKAREESGSLHGRRQADGSWRIYRKDLLLDEAGEVATSLPKSVWSFREFTNDYGRKAIKDLFGRPLMDFPKSPALLADVCAIGGGHDGDIVLDFFAGSGTMGHAVMAQNAADGGSRRYILVQLPEPTGRKDYSTIAEICRERVRRAGEKVRGENPLFHGDLGFRVFRLDSSNIREWDPQPEDVAGAVQGSIEHLKAHRSEDDVLYELLLKLGLDLALPIEKRMIGGKAVHSAGAGTLFACLAPEIALQEVEALALGIAAWRDELAPAGGPQVVFRDSAFADDVAKSNCAAILEQHGFLAANLRSI